MECKKHKVHCNPYNKFDPNGDINKYNSLTINIVSNNLLCCDISLKLELQCLIDTLRGQDPFTMVKSESCKRLYYQLSHKGFVLNIDNKGV